MAYKFGAEMSFEHGVFLVLVAVLAALVLPVRDVIAANGWRSTAKGCTYVLAPLLIFGEFFSHLGYTFGQRDGNVSTAIHQTVALREQGESLAEAKASLTRWQQRLADLEQRNAWVPTVTADGIRAQIDTMDEAIRQEERRGGCGPRCLTLKQQRAALDARRATLEERKDLTDRIEAARAIIDRQRDKVATAAKSENGHSAVVAQTTAFAKLYTMSLTPDAGSLDGVKMAIGVFIALLATIVPPAALTLACRMGRRPEDDITPANDTAPPVAPANVARETPSAAGSTVIRTIADNREVWAAIRKALDQPNTKAA
jgi:leucyl-tRNA synthetase